MLGLATRPGGGGVGLEVRGLLMYSHGSSLPIFDGHSSKPGTPMIQRKIPGSRGDHRVPGTVPGSTGGNGTRGRVRAGGRRGRGAGRRAGARRGARRGLVRGNGTAASSADSQAGPTAGASTRGASTITSSSGGATSTTGGGCSTGAVGMTGAVGVHPGGGGRLEPAGSVGHRQPMYWYQPHAGSPGRIRSPSTMISSTAYRSLRLRLMLAM